MQFYRFVTIYIFKNKNLRIKQQRKIEYLRKRDIDFSILIFKSRSRYCLLVF